MVFTSHHVHITCLVLEVSSFKCIQVYLRFYRCRGFRVTSSRVSYNSSSLLKLFLVTTFGLFMYIHYIDHKPEGNQNMYTHSHIRVSSKEEILHGHFIFWSCLACSFFFSIYNIFSELFLLYPHNLSLFQS